MSFLRQHSCGMANSIRARREAAGLTQVELGERARLAQGTVSGIETGAIVLGLHRALRIAAVLGCSIEELLAPMPRRRGTRANGRAVVP